LTVAFVVPKGAFVVATRSFVANSFCAGREKGPMRCMKSPAPGYDITITALISAEPTPPDVFGTLGFGSPAAERVK